MSKTTTVLVIVLGVLLALAAGKIGHKCESHDPQGNLRGTMLDCAR